MNPWPPHLYRKAAGEAAVAPEVVERALGQANTVLSKSGCPPILTLKHLAVETDTSFRVLRSIVGRYHPHPYRCFFIGKRQGGRRLICVPTPPLLRVQQWICRHVLSLMSPHIASYAYAPRRSALACARMHCEARWLIKVDVRQFFESISERQVYKVFLESGYQPLVAFELTRLCTRIAVTSRKKYRRHRWNNSRSAGEYSIENYWAFGIGHLPQGAPTSPMLSNLAVRQLDERLTARCSEWGLVYTRYADDLHFSTADESFTRDRAALVIRAIYEALRESGLRPRTSKTHVSPPGARKVVLGLLVDRNRPRLSKEFKERLELHVYHLLKHGPRVHLERRGFRTFGGMRDHIRGLLTYAEHVEPDFAEPLLERVEQVVWPV